VIGPAVARTRPLLRLRAEKAEELRAKFVANREQVRSWVADWHFPEVTWPAVPALPSPWSAIEQNEKWWFEDPESSMAAVYDWVLDARPRTESIGRVKCLWRFRRGHVELL
jgi:hypothetical protein